MPGDRGPAAAATALRARHRMWAAVCDGRGGLVAELVARPRPSAGEVLLRLRCAGVCGTDLWKIAAGTAAPGAILGHEVVGIVEAVGAGGGGHVSAHGGRPTGIALDGRRPVAPGDRVVALHHVACGACPLCLAGSEPMCPAFRENLLAPGGFCELVRVRRRAAEAALYLIPEHLSDEAALFLEPAACVLRGLVRAGLAVLRRPGGGGAAGDGLAIAEAAAGPQATVAILGGGSMGLLHLLALRALGGAAGTAAHHIVVVEPLAERRALARRLGADAAMAPGEALRRLAASWEGRGADVVFDTVGGATILRQALQIGRPGGTVILFAHAAADGDLDGGGGGSKGDGRGEDGGEPGAGAAAEAAADFPLNLFFKTERRLIGTYSSGRSEQEAAYRLLAQGRLDPRPLASHRLALRDAPAAVGLAATHRAVKVLLVPEGGGGTAGDATPGGGS